MAGKKRKVRFNPPSRPLVMAAIFMATITTTLLSFISVELALLSFGLFSLAALAYSESRRRSFWEQAASFKFKSLKDAQAHLAKELVMQSRELDDVKQEVEITRKSVEKIQNTADNVEDDMQIRKRMMGAVRKPVPFELDVHEDPVPRAIKAADFSAQPREHEEMSDAVVRELLHYAIQEKRVDVFVQPIMRLPQRQTRFYEMFARIRARPGQYLPAARYMEIAEQDNLDDQIDTLLLMHCLQTIQDSAHIEKAAPFFINIKPSTLKNGAFMKRLLGFLSKNRSLAPRLVFEMQQTDFDQIPTAMMEVLRGLGTLGCSFSLDHTQSLKRDILDLQNFKVRYVKIDARKLLYTSGEREFAEMHRHKRKLESNGIGVIVEKIETENDLRDLLDFDIHYGQGYLFGKPELEGAYKNRARVRRMGLAGTAS